MNPENEEIENIKERLRLAEDTLNAIRNGNVDALVIKGSKGEQLYSVVSPDHPYQVFFENMDEAAAVLSNEQIILYGNRSFFEMIGAPSETIIGTSILNLIEESHHSYFIECILKYRKKKTEFLINTRQNGRRRVSASIFEGIWSDSEAQCLLLRDITELKRAQHFAETSHSLARTLSEAPTLSIASQSMIELLYVHLGWEVVIIWVWNKKKQVLQCLEIAQINNLDIEIFEKKNREIGIEEKELFSYVCLSNRPTWVKDIAEEFNFLRKDEAIQNNLHGALAFPFNKDSEVGGFVELFRQKPFEEGIDPLLFDFIGSIGMDLGFYIQRLFSDQTKYEIAKALELSFNCIYTTNLKGTLLSWNRGAENIYGWTDQEMIGSNITRLYPLEKIDTYNKVFQSFLTSGRPLEKSQSQRVRKNGELIWITESYDKSYDLFGDVSGVIIVEQEITHEKELAKHLANCEDKFNSFIEITKDWIWELDIHGNFQFSNMKVYEFLGYEIKEILGKSFLYFLHFEDREEIENKIREFQIKKTGWNNLETPFFHKGGSYRWIESNAKELLNEEGHLIGFRGTSRDITESKNLEKIKNEFISIVSHELRTPLTTISGALGLLMGKEMPPEEKQQLTSIAYKNSLRLGKIINDTMDIEKLQLGKLKFDFKKINLRDVVQESISLNEIIQNKFNVKVIAENSMPIAEIMGDYWRLVQVMNNLLSNAIKFSPSQGTVSVSLKIKDNFARVSIQDRGLGIPKAFQAKIFQSFAQADSSIKREVGGTGLGLYISKSIIDSHRGRIEYISNPEEGTTFYFEIPLINSPSAKGES